MGADLYIEKMDNKDDRLWLEVSDRAVARGYFRDCYNAGGLFAVMSATLGKQLSWWEMSERVGLKDRVLPLAQVIKWQADLEPLIAAFKRRRVLYYNDYATKKRGKVAKNQIKEYHKWADRLMTFCNLAIEKESGIIWSV